MKRIIIASLFLTFGSAHSFAADFSTKFSWCSGSPIIDLMNVPKGTTKLEFSMPDLNYPKNHLIAKMDYKNEKKIPCGELNKGYEGPMPPPPQVHTYELTITAIDKDGKILGKAVTSRKFPE